MRRIIPGLVALVACISALLVAPAGANPAPWGYTNTTPGSRPMPLTPTAQSAPAGSHLGYLGGPVISNVSVQGVYWGTGDPTVCGPTKTHPCYVTGTGPNDTPIVEFFQGFTDSTHMDWLTEYNTSTQVNRLPGVPGQTIGRGSYAGRTTITVSPANRGNTITSAAIEDELRHQLSSGALPPPQLDAHGQVNTLYAMFFPENVTIMDGTAIGGEPGGFCAYHGTVLHDSVAVPYMVLPDFDSHQFNGHCGGDPLLYNNFTSVTSHEIIESVTDPLVGVGVASWIDEASALEIADICQPQQSKITGGNGLTLVVQQEFSNFANDCIATRSVPAPARRGYVNACGLAGRSGFDDAGLAADCLKQYGVAQGKNDGTFGENDGLVRSQVSSLLARLIELSGGTLSTTHSFPDVDADAVPNAQVRSEIELLAGAGIIAGYPDGQFHPLDNLSVAQAVALVTRTLEFIHSFDSSAPNVVEQGSTAADYAAATGLGLLDTDATNVAGFVYGSAASDGTDRGLLADVLAQSIQRLVDSHVVAVA